MAESNRMSNDEIARRAMTNRESQEEWVGLLDARCPECSDKLRKHKDASCLHAWVMSLLAQIRYVEHVRDFWKRQYHNRQIEDATQEGSPNCPVCKGRGWYESWSDCNCGGCPEYETVMCQCHAKYIGRKRNDTSQQ